MFILTLINMFVNIDQPISKHITSFYKKSCSFSSFFFCVPEGLKTYQQMFFENIDEDFFF